MKKPKLEILGSKSVSARSSLSASSKVGNPLAPKRNYKKQSKSDGQKLQISFGQTGVTGRS